ncbi:dynamin family protein [Chengkuizengella axinellae]|uniref:Dynamin family protein n=1 Tax=Chengkuizengella axinellae TaxID=3064388 RepID=A0ABT9IX01_9BACL|nr:dynamin family protein [Chengkuizengella sp. 2205SS18-9]MDP5273894.1 dynamin family protein [Chengkuizengella sp. 2205SS18-9]
MKIVGETIHKYAENILELSNVMEVSKDTESGQKLKQLADKLEASDLYFTFCGHFSAGKSSLINKLSGHPILPSSPIPTSANLVAISNGDPKAVLHYRDVQKKQSIEQIELGQLQEYGKNGSEIESIEIQYPIPMLEDHVHFLDTPGIDSTDEAHLLSTESALHLADIVFYVMDYNHVQSEINFSFAKRLQEQEKKFIFIVNQIDKHQDQELSFSDFKQSVNQAFRDWDIHPEAIFFISVKQDDYIFNEFDQLKWYLKCLTQIRESLLISNVEKSIEFLLNEHMKAKKEQNEVKKQQLTVNSENSDLLLEELSILTNNRNEIEETSIKYLDQLKYEISDLLQNANVIPAATRDLAHEYLQSRQPGFRMGLFSTKGKIKAEHDKRLNRFFEDFSEKVQAHIMWHLKDLLNQRLNAQVVNESMKSEVQKQIDELEVKLSPEWLMGEVNTGAAFSNEYTLNFSKHISEEMKKIYRKRAINIANLLLDISQNTYQEKMVELQNEIEKIQKQLVDFKQLQEINKRETQYEQKLFSIIQWDKQAVIMPNLNEYSPSKSKTESQSSELKSKRQGMEVSINVEQSSPVKHNKLTSNFSKKETREKITKTIDQLNTAYKMIKDLPAMNSLSSSLLEKSNRLNHRRFTISLFGAFSAGKSSFANALLGERLLPVSPNPTTATVIKIMPPDEKWSHGIAKVKIKTKEVILEEIQYAMEQLGFQNMGIDQSFVQISKIKANGVHRKAKPHYAFLKAALNGWKDIKQDLGQELKVDIDTFQSFAADESKSCYVEYIELYYSCPFTDSGMILVDTPGADSINARHTGVAFDYIKNADAILFVTYYNHAFSQADREFLLQLGRVKDQFELDKMFFVLNAADLASSKQELEAVEEHVKHNLAQHEIRNPRIYPLSSLKALESKQSGDEQAMKNAGITAFEMDFIRFTDEELTEMAIQAANIELNRATNTLEQWKNNALQEGKLRKEKVKHLSATMEELNTWFIQFNLSEFEEKSLRKEIKELLYYVKQRVMYRFGELYNVSFHPSDFGMGRKEGLKQALHSAWNELHRLLSMNCSQEVLATTLRLENYMNEQLKGMNNQFIQHTALKLPQFETEALNLQTYHAPSIQESLGDIEMDLNWLVKQFKDPKSFFEGQGKGKLKIDLEKKLSSVIESYIREHEELLIEHATSEMRSWIQRMIMKQKNDVQEHVDGFISALEMKLDIKEIEAKVDALKAM